MQVQKLCQLDGNCEIHVLVVTKKFFFEVTFMGFPSYSASRKVGLHAVCSVASTKLTMLLVVFFNLSHTLDIAYIYAFQCAHA